MKLIEKITALIGTGMIGAGIWIGTIQTKVSALEDDNAKTKPTIEKINDHLQYMRGRMDEKWGKKR